MKKIVLFGLVLIGLSSCKPEIEAPILRSNLADVDKVIYFGDSYLSGYQDAALFQNGNFCILGRRIFL